MLCTAFERPPQYIACLTPIKVFRIQSLTLSHAQASSTSGEGQANGSSWSDYVRDNPLARRIKEWQTGLSSKLAFGVSGSFGGVSPQRGGRSGGSGMDGGGQSRAACCAGRRHKPADSVESLENLRHSRALVRYLALCPGIDQGRSTGIRNLLTLGKLSS